MPGPQPRLHLPYDQWPPADRRLWENALRSDDDPFDRAAGAHLAETSRRQYLNGWRRFLGFLANKEPDVLSAAPADRLTIESVRAFVSHLAQSNTPHSVAIQTDAVYKAARIMMPQHDWVWLKDVKARLCIAAPARGATGPVITSLQLLDLGQQLMDEHHPPQDGQLRMADAIGFRDGLMFALQAFNPLRRKNLATLEIDRHLIKERESWFIVVPAAETKTGATIEFAIPELLHPYLATYLNVVRPRMLRLPNCKVLWVSPKGGALSYSAIWPIFTRHSNERLGIQIAPHDARDAAATMWAIVAPADVNVSQDLLAHRDERTKIKHYNRARGVEASRALAQVIAKMKRARC